MSRYKAYPEYKDSGVEWLGKIPVGWDCVRLKFASELSGKKVVPSNEEKYVGLENIQSNNGRFVATEDVTPEGISNSFSCGDVLFGKLRPYLAKSWLANFSGICSSELLVLTSKKVNSRFLHYFTLTEEFIDQVDSSTYGSKMPRASWDFIGLLEVPIPCNESEKIAHFLDYETAKIDALIERQQQLIELLKEKRQAVISHAVTKGLNPKAPMRDSGVEWLGEVPAHWRTPKLLNQASRVGDGLHAAPQYQDGTDIYFINGNNLIDGEVVVGSTAKEVPVFEYEKNHIHLDGSSVLLSINGTIGNVALYKEEKIILGKSAAYINCSHGLMSRYLIAFLQSDSSKRYYEQEVTGTTIYNLSLNSIRKMRVPIPPEAEQKEIVVFCEKQKIKYATLVEQAGNAINLMQERRTALISAAVTGKIDVRDWQAAA